MERQTYERMKNLVANAKQIKEKIGEIEEHENKTTQMKHYDKYDMGFNNDSRFSSAKVTISVDAYLGYYGNSSCSTVRIVKDASLFKQYFIKILNRRFKNLMFEVSEEMQKDAMELKEKSLDELNEIITEVKYFKIEE